MGFLNNVENNSMMGINSDTDIIVRFIAKKINGFRDNLDFQNDPMVVWKQSLIGFVEDAFNEGTFENPYQFIRWVSEVNTEEKNMLEDLVRGIYEVFKQ